MAQPGIRPTRWPSAGARVAADMHGLNSAFADHVGRAEGLIWHDATLCKCGDVGELRRDQSCRLTTAAHNVAVASAAANFTRTSETIRRPSQLCLARSLSGHLRGVKRDPAHPYHQGC
jgi:hypothetical protein